MLLKQGKTNWKYILIVVVLAMVIGGGIWWQQHQQIQKDGAVPSRIKRWLNNNEMLKQMFPDYAVKNGKIEVPIFEEFGTIEFYLEEVVRKPFIDPNEENLLLMVDLKGLPHVGGMHHTFLGLFNSNGNLLTNSFHNLDSLESLDMESGHFSGDKQSFDFYNCSGITYILATPGGFINGLGWVSGAYLIKINEVGKLEIVQNVENVARQDLGKNKDIDTRLEDRKVAFYYYDEEKDDYGSRELIHWGNFIWNPLTCRFEKDETADWETYQSPDNLLRAQIIPVGQTKESVIQIRTNEGILLQETDYSSEDGDHGLIIASAEWTPDSQFFIYSAYNSGGHQPWFSRVYFYSRSDNTISDFKEVSGFTVARDEFAVAAPDIVTLTVYTSVEIGPTITKSFRLNEIVNNLDWKTYRNDEYEFEVEYPPDWIYSEETTFYQKDSEQVEIDLVGFIDTGIDPETPILILITNDPDIVSDWSGEGEKIIINNRETKLRYQFELEGMQYKAVVIPRTDNRAVAILGSGEVFKDLYKSFRYLE